MTKLRKITIATLAFALVFLLAFAAACTPADDGDKTEKVTVSFVVDGTVQSTQEVKKNTRITKPTTDPTFADADKVFTSWFTDEACLTEWSFVTGIVTADMSLYAGFKVVSSAPSALSKAEEAVTSKLVWTQRAMSQATNYKVELTNVKSGVASEVAGTYAFDAEKYTVTFTPSTIPQGGLYNVKLSDTSDSQNVKTLTVENVLFSGEGTSANPYLIGDALDFTAVSQQSVAEGVCFVLFRNITISPFRTEQKGFVFNGELIGSGRTITLDTANCGAIYQIGEKGRVYNLNVVGTISTLQDSVGGIADFNKGTVEKVTSTVYCESTAGLVGSINITKTLDENGDEGTRGIAGCIVGTNETSGKIVNCKVVSESSTTGRLAANIGGGLIVGYNKGEVTNCSTNGTVGGANTKLIAKSVSKYSYCGGIVGINSGKISECLVSEDAIVLAQRYARAEDVVAKTNNANIGGVVGYNTASGQVTECLFSGVRVHGDENVGGIVGLNEGAISSCGFEGIYNTNSSRNMVGYVGGRINVGGIAGSGNGTVANCFVTGNVFGFTAGTAYSVSANATNSVYLSANPDAGTKSVADDYSGAANYVEADNLVALTAPTGDGNVAVTDVFDGTKSVTLASTYLTTLGDKFFYNSTSKTVRLAYEQNIVPEDTIEVALYNDKVLWSNIKVAETPSTIEGPYLRGNLFAGWSFTSDGEIDVASTAKVSMYDLQDYADVNGVVKLYARFTPRPAATGLKIAVFSRYVSADDLAAVKSGFTPDGFEVTYVEIAETTVALFGAAVNEAGDFDLIIGSGANIATAGGVKYISRTNIDANNEAFSTDFKARQVALLTDTDYAMQFYAYMTGLESKDAEVTVKIGETEVKSSLNSLLKNEAAIPEFTVPDGSKFVGWATTEDATKAQITTQSVVYADVSGLLVDGKVTLYPVFEEIKVIVITDTEVNVAVWDKAGDWITAAELEAIKTGFVQYLQDNGIDTTKLTITYTVVAGSKVADLGAATNALEKVDIVIGCGANVTTTGGVATLEKAVISTEIVAASRYAALTTENTIAAVLYDYLVG